MSILYLKAYNLKDVELEGEQYGNGKGRIPYKAIPYSSLQVGNIRSLKY